MSGDRVMSMSGYTSAMACNYDVAPHIISNSKYMCKIIISISMPGVCVHVYIHVNYMATSMFLSVSVSKYMYVPKSVTLS